MCGLMLNGLANVENFQRLDRGGSVHRASDSFIRPSLKIGMFLREFYFAQTCRIKGVVGHSASIEVFTALCTAIFDFFWKKNSSQN